MQNFLCAFRVMMTEMNLRRLSLFAFSLVLHLAILYALSRAVFRVAPAAPPVTVVRLVDARQPLAEPGGVPQPARASVGPGAGSPPAENRTGPGRDPAGSPSGRTAIPTDGETPAAPRSYPRLREFLSPPSWDEPLPFSLPAIREATGRAEFGLALGDGMNVDPGTNAHFRSRGIDAAPWATAVVAALCRAFRVSPDLPLPALGEAGVAVGWDGAGRALPELRRSSGSPLLDQALLNTVELSREALRQPESWGNRRDLFLLFRFLSPGAPNPATLPVLRTAATELNDPAVARIGLLDVGDLVLAAPPPRLTLGVEMRHALSYRLFQGDELVAGGGLHPGMNRLPLPVADLLAVGGQRDFRLELLENGVGRELPVSLRALVEKPANSGQVPDGLRAAGFGVALFMDNRLLAWQSRPLSCPVYSRNERERRDRALQRRLGLPPDPLRREERELQKASVPVMALPMLAWRALRRGRTRRLAAAAEAEARNPLCAGFRVTLLLNPPQADPQPAEVSVSLR